MSIKRSINNIIPEIIEQIGHVVNPLLLNFKNEKNKLLIFYFHGLYESFAQKDLHHIDPQNNITTQEFSNFIEYFLHHKYCFIKPEDLLNPLKSEKRYAMITFDDGYFNNMLAIEVLNKYKIPAVFFLSTSHIVEQKSYWWDIIYKYRFKRGISLSDIRNEQQQLKKLKWQEIDTYIENEFGNTAYNPWSDIDRPFTELEIRSIAANPLVSIGNHTHHHAILTNYDSGEVKAEINSCNEIISELTEKSPVSIAFPNGNFNNESLNIAAEIGLKIAFTTRNRGNNLPIKGNQMICLDRFMAKTESIKKYGSFTRLGYNKNDLYHGLKKKFSI